MVWWIWCVLGLVLLAGEMFTPGSFILFFFGLAAVLVSLFTSLTVLEGDSAQWLFFSLFSIITLVLFRSRLRKGMLGGEPTTDLDAIVGTTGKALSEIAGNSAGQVEHRGTSWSALNRSAATIAAGEECRIVEVTGLRLTVEKL